MSAPVRDERRPGWLWVDNAVVLEHGAELGAVGIAVYVGLASYANVERKAWPGLRGLAKRLGMGKSTVHRAVAKLEALGLVQIERQESTHGDADTNRYVLVRQEDPEGCPATGTRVPLEVHGVPLEDHGGVPLEVRNKNQSSEQESVNKKTRRTRRADMPFPEDFTLTDVMAAKIRLVGCRNPPAAFEQFKNHHLAKGTLSASWGNSWATWVGNHGVYACPCQRDAGKRAQAAGGQPYLSAEETRARYRGKA